MSAPDLATALAQQAEFATRIITLGHRAGLKPVQSLDYALKGLVPDAWVAGAAVQPAAPPDMLAGIRCDLSELAAGIADRLDGLERRLEKIAPDNIIEPVEHPPTGQLPAEPGTEGSGKTVDAAGCGDAPVPTGRPVEGLAADACGGGVIVTGQACTSVQPSGAGEGVNAPVDAAPDAGSEVDSKVGRQPHVGFSLLTGNGQVRCVEVPCWTAKLLATLYKGPKTSSELVDVAAAPSMEVVRRITRRLNDDLEPVGFRIVSEMRRSEKGHKAPYLYRLIENAVDAAPEPAKAVYGRTDFDPLVSEAEAAKIAETLPPPQPMAPAPEPVMPSPLPPNPLAVKRQPQATPPALAATAFKIAPGHVVAVDTAALMISGPSGAPYKLNGPAIARALEALRSGQLFGLSFIVTKVGKTASKDRVREFLKFEGERLKSIGVEVVFVGDNVRLRRIEGGR
jgi:hypothetical protein